MKRVVIEPGFNYSGSYMHPNRGKAMCVMIDWKGEEMLDQQGRLAERVPEIRYKEQYPESTRRMSGCLCPVDVPATLNEAGVEWESNHGIPDYEVGCM